MTATAGKEKVLHLYYVTRRAKPAMAASAAARGKAAAEIEAKGWREWLLTLMPFAFEEDFSADHIRFWDLYWSVLMRIREQRKYFASGVVPDDPDEPQKQEKFFRDLGIFIEDDEYVILCIWGRGLGKSATVEAGAVARGCILGSGYCLYVCRESGQAEEHIDNCRGLIDDPESRVAEFYPHMFIDENAVFKGKKTKNRTDLFITTGGWICRAKGMEASLRGIRVGNLRPDSIVIDDVDDVDDSVAVSIKRLNRISASVIPTQARRHATILVGQNIIIETGVVNQIFTGQSDVLSARTVIGVSNTFEHFRLNLEYTTYLDESEGRVRHKILAAARPTWKGVNLAAAQKFLNDSGLETFQAEYMNSFAHQKTGKVFEFDEARHLVTWDQFEKMFGVRYIPGHWRAKASADLGYSKDSLSAWLFVARSAQNSKLAGRYFAYRSLTFEMDSIDDQATKIWPHLFPERERGKKHFEATQRFADYPELHRLLNLNARCAPYMKHFTYDAVKDQYRLNPIDSRTWDEVPEEDKALFYVKQAHQTFQSQIQSWVISHEKTGEQKTLAQKYGIPVSKVSRFEADAGVAEANHLLRGDYTQPHPFHDDEIVPETGLYKLGSPYIFFLVRRIPAPEGDDDFRTFREHVGGQRWTQEKLRDSGLTKTVPFKHKSDHCFVAGTLVTTDKGDVPIERIKPGDMILTRQGYKPCCVAQLTDPAAEIWELITDDGRVLRGTGNHPVWLENKGFTPLEEVSQGDILLLTCENHRQSGKPSSTTARLFIDTLKASVLAPANTIVAIIKAGKSGCTSLFGRMQMEPWPHLATASITKTTIGTITIPVISNVSERPTTQSTTLTSLRILHRSPKIWQKLRKLQKNGTQRMQGEHGTGNMPKRSLPTWSRIPSPVSTAVRSASRKLRGGSNSAPRAVSNANTTDFPKNRPLDYVRSVPNLLASTTDAETRSKSIAQGSVQVVRPTSDVQPVYNLSVDEVSEYFANGVLVSNCDALRMFAVDYALPESTKKTMSEEIEARIPERYRVEAGKPLSMEEEMSARIAREYAEEKTAIEFGLVDEDDDEWE